MLLSTVSEWDENAKYCIFERNENTIEMLCTILFEVKPKSFLQIFSSRESLQYETVVVSGSCCICMSLGQLP